MRKTSYRWAWAEGARMRKGCNASELGPEIMRLLKLYKQRLTADQLLAEATGSSSPLHVAFGWDDAEAAHQYRLVEARHLLRSIQYAFETSDGEIKERSTTIIARVLRAGSYYYATVKPSEIVKEHKLDCKRLAELAIRQLEVLQKKCPSFGKLAIVGEAIRQLKAKNKEASRKGARKGERSEGGRGRGGRPAVLAGGSAGRCGRGGRPDEGERSERGRGRVGRPEAPAGEVPEGGKGRKKAGKPAAFDWSKAGE